MKTLVIVHPAIRPLLKCALLLICLMLLPQLAEAADYDSSLPTGQYSREELAQMLAPVALYPDAVLAQVLMASTYPIEVIEADRWVTRNPGLSGDNLDNVLLDQDWDPSVKAICHFPSILALMSERITETTNLGNAFLAQEDEVMDMVQELRAKAYAQGTLETTTQQKVLVERETIIIEPANPRVIYVPYYDPFYVYGPWWYPDYPPYYWGPRGVSLGVGYSFWPGFYFSFSFGSWSYFDWPHHYVYIDVHKRPRYVRHDRWLSTPGRWHHVPRHRRGVAYRDKETARRYGQGPYRSRDFQRNTRGFPVSDGPDRYRNRRPIDRTRADLKRDSGDRRSIDRDRTATERFTRENRQQRPDQRPGQDRVRIEKSRPERDQTNRQQVDQKQRARLRFESQSQQRNREDVFSGVDNGARERVSAERGRASRQGRNSDWLDKRRSEGNHRGDRGNWNRSRQ